MFERASTLVDDIPVEEKYPPISEINVEAIKMLTETTMTLSMIINDISGRVPDESPAGKDEPHCVREQAALIAQLAAKAMRMTRDIKCMVTA